MDRLHNERAVELPRQGATIGKPVWSKRVGSVAGVPDDVNVVADDRNPVKAKIEVHALIRVVELYEAEERGAGADIILQVAARLHRGESAFTELYGTA